MPEQVLRCIELEREQVDVLKPLQNLLRRRQRIEVHQRIRRAGELKGVERGVLAERDHRDAPGHQQLGGRLARGHHPTGGPQENRKIVANAGDRGLLAPALVADGATFRLERVSRQTPEARPPSARPESEPKNQLIARTAPMPRFCPYWEPCNIVRNFTDDPQTEGGRVRLQQLRDHGQSMREAWARNGAPDPADALAQGRGNAPDDDGPL